MVGFFVRAGKAYKALKEGTKSITSVKPLKKITGSKTVEQHKKQISNIKSEAISKKSHYFFPPLNICVPFIPNILAHTSIHKLVNHFGSAEK